MDGDERQRAALRQCEEPRLLLSLCRHPSPVSLVSRLLQRHLHVVRLPLPLRRAPRYALSLSARNLTSEWEGGSQIRRVVRTGDGGGTAYTLTVNARF